PPGRRDRHHDAAGTVDLDVVVAGVEGEVEKCLLVDAPAPLDRGLAEPDQQIAKVAERKTLVDDLGRHLRVAIEAASEQLELEHVALAGETERVLDVDAVLLGNAHEVGTRQVVVQDVEAGDRIGVGSHQSITIGSRLRGRASISSSRRPWARSSSFHSSICASAMASTP